MLLAHQHQPQSLPFSATTNASICFRIVPDQSKPHISINLNLNRGRNTRTHIKVFSEAGELVYEQRDAKPHKRAIIWIKGLTPGTYFFECNDGFYFQIKELEIM